MLRHTFIKIAWYLVPATLFACAGDTPPAKQASSTILYMDKPAASWYEATPIGNGRLGGMVYGGVVRDTIRTNEDTFWSGEPRDVQRPGTYKVLPEIRKLLLEEKNREAQKVIDAHMLGPWNQNYMPLADLLKRRKTDPDSNKCRPDKERRDDSWPLCRPSQIRQAAKRRNSCIRRGVELES